MYSYRKYKLLAVFVAFTMILGFLPAMAGADAHDPVPNYAFIPNSGEASVSKVDVADDPAVEVARYYTAPRLEDKVDLVGQPTGDPNTIAPLAWRTSRIALDADNNAYVLNVGSDALGLTGSVARIQADTTGLTSTALTATPLPFGSDEAVQILPVGNSQEMPRAIVIDGDGFIWVGFYGSGRLVKYAYNPAGPSLDIVGEWTNAGIGFYEMKLAPNGTIFISSRQSTSAPDRPGIVQGIYTFSGGVFASETTWSPYALLIDPDGTVYATGYSNLLYIRNAGTGIWSSVDITGSSQNRGMAFDGLGKVWIASTVGTSGGTVVYSYVIATGLLGPTYTLTSGTTPVGLGRDVDGTMWVICRTDGNATGGYIEGFKPDTLAKVGAVQVGFRPYAYGDFVVPAVPETYGFCGYKYVDGVPTGGWEILLEVEVNDGWAKFEQDGLVNPATTGLDGKYCFDGLPAGTYRVSEVLQPGFTQVYPVPNEHIVVLPAPDPKVAPYPAYSVVDFSQGLRKDGSPVRDGRSDPNAVLTYDLGRDETNFFSLGFKFDDGALPEGGWIILEFDCPIRNGEGDDIMVVEDTWGSYPLETADVYASKDGMNWVYLGAADNTERTVNDIHTESYFDLEDVGMDWARFIKVVDTTPIGAMPNNGDGYDLNTVVALHDCEPTYNFYNETDLEPVCETAWGWNEDATENSELNGVNNWGWYFGPLTENDEGISFELWAGAGQNDRSNGEPVGTGTITYSGDEVTVTVTMDDGYILDEFHVWVGETELPITRKDRQGEDVYTSAPGQFIRYMIEDDVDVDYDEDGGVFTVEGLDGPIYVAVHIVACWYE